VWVPGNQLFTVDGSGAEVLTNSGKEKLDSMMEAFLRFTNDRARRAESRWTGLLSYYSGNRGIMSHTETERAGQEAIQANRYSIRLWIVLSLILSLSTVVILSKRQLLNHRWAYGAAVIVPILFVLHFRSRIVLFGPFVYVAVLVLSLMAAVYFGL